MRKIIQITTGSYDDIEDDSRTYTLIALCDDGTVWKLLYGVTPRWQQLIEIPQENGPERVF